MKGVKVQIRIWLLIVDFSQLTFMVVPSFKLALSSLPVYSLAGKLLFTGSPSPEMSRLPGWLEAQQRPDLGVGDGDTGYAQGLFTCMPTNVR